MNILVAGGTGFVGQQLCRALVARGDTVTVVSRDPAGAQRRALPGVSCRGWLPSLEGYHAIVNLTGEPIFGRRWNAEVKRELRDSRVLATRRIVDALHACARMPAVLINASAIGYYGSRGAEQLPESAAPGTDFMAGLCQAWEQEAVRSRTRTVLMRFGVILGEGGGALSQMLPVFRLGLGGPIGLGRQWFSWVHVDDVVGLTLQALDDQRLHGPVNVTAPGVVTNAKFSRALGRVLRRPALLPVPALALRVKFGEVSQVLTGSQRCEALAAQRAGYAFRYPEIEGALQSALGTR
ncbi:MAG: TIGR01777 family oxidoreductase [Planctomycetota bacterium]